MALHVVEEGDGESVLLLPGFTDSIESARDLRRHLATTYRVIAADLPGSGRSGPMPRTYSAHFYEEDADAMSELLDRSGARSVRIVGHSDGGEVALLMAARRPDLVRAVVAVSAMGVVPSAEVIETIGNLVDSPLPAVAAFGASLVERYGRENALAMTKSWAAASRTIADRGGDLSLGLADAIRCPVLLVVGEKDRFVPAAQANRLASRLASSAMVLVPDAGHNPHRERAEWFNSLMTAWLASH